MIGSGLEVRNLWTTFITDDGPVDIVRDVSFTLNPGETTFIVGESGSGKSVTALSIMGLLPRNAHTRGSIFFDGQNLLEADQMTMRRLRGNRIAMVFQDAQTALNPVVTVGAQLTEVLWVHRRSIFPTKADRRSEAIAMLERVGIPDPAGCMSRYVFQLSGGQKQRVMIAMALLCRPKLLIADEPTTALDVTIQAQVLKLIKSLEDEHQMAILFITHDLGVVADLADRVIVMYGGRVVETGHADAVFGRHRHPYTDGLLKSMPSFGDPTRVINPIRGLPPKPIDIKEGCPFWYGDRCPYGDNRCHTEVRMRWPVPDHGTYCIHDEVPQ